MKAKFLFSNFNVPFVNMDSYLIRIYRRDKKNPEAIIGFIEEIGAEKQESFGNLNVTFGQSTEAAGEIVNRYPTGKKVKVFYNPQDLKVAVLEPGVSTSSYLFLGFGILFTLMGLIFLIRFVRA